MGKIQKILRFVGLDTSKPAEYIKGTPNCQNVEVERAQIRSRTGTSTFGDAVSSSSSSSSSSSPGA